MMIKMQMLVLSAAVFSFLVTPLAYANNKQDPLQSYRDEIKRMEANASQTVLDQLKVNDSNASSNTIPAQSAPTPPPQSPISNNDKAFSPPTVTQNNTITNSNKSNSDNNPWLKPNPWEAQAHVNPWANAPIPSGDNTTPNNSSAFVPPPAPPNIFAPPHPTVSTPNKTTNNNTTR